jgi:hypothetical protein
MSRLDSIWPNVVWDTEYVKQLDQAFERAMENLAATLELEVWAERHDVALGLTSTLSFLQWVEQPERAHLRMTGGLIAYHRRFPIRPLLAQNAQQLVLAFERILMQMLEAVAVRLNIPTPTSSV